MAVNPNILFGKELNRLDTGSSTRNLEQLGGKGGFLTEKTAFTRRLLKKAGITVDEQTLGFLGNQGNLRLVGNRFQSGDGLIAAQIFNSVDQIRKLNSASNALQSPGILPEDKTRLEAEVTNSAGNAKTLLSTLEGAGFSSTDFGDVFQQFSNAGIEFTEGEFPGAIEVKPPSFVEPKPPEDIPELPPEPPPLEDVIEQQPEPPIVQPPAQPGGGQPPGTQPIEAPAETGEAVRTERAPIRKVIAVPDPRNPGELIEIPVVDRGIPGDIDRQADQFLIEREGLRQQEQSRRAFEGQRAIRGERLGDLSDLLLRQEEFQFGQRRPTIAEEAQTGGLLRSSGFGEALARERRGFAEQSRLALSQQALSDREFEAQGISGILGQRQAFQGSALQRRFSLEDFERSARLSRELGASSAPQVGGGKGFSLGSAASGAAIGGGIGGPPGAAIGAGLGLAAGGGK